jgi:hypothetical protein
MKCNETICKWCKNKHGASKIIDTLETYQLVEEVARLKSESTKAEELAKTRRLEAESREKDLHQRLQTSLDVLRSESSISFLNFSALTKFPIDWRSCSFLKPLPNWTPEP